MPWPTQRYSDQLVTFNLIVYVSLSSVLAMKTIYQSRTHIRMYKKHIYNVYTHHIPVAILFIHICLYLILLKIYALRIFPRLKCLFNWIFYVIVCVSHI